jgi:hypothetical protein
VPSVDGGDTGTTREANGDEYQLAGEEKGEKGEEYSSTIDTMPGATIDTVDQMMDNVFGYHVHHNFHDEDTTMRW